MIASLILLLHFLGIISPESAYTSLYIAGAILLIAEIGVVSLGLLTINGLLAIYAGFTLQMGNQTMFGIDLGWPLLLGVAFAEFLVIGTVITVYLKIKSTKQATGTESMIGEKATVISWTSKKGSVRYEGEIWIAISTSELELRENDEVTIESVNKLNLTISA